MKHYIVVAAIIEKEGKVLCMQRKESKYEYISLKYEFPGGKVEAGETESQALQREIQEELEISIEINQAFLTVNHQYPDFKLRMHSYLCTTQSEKPYLKEHLDYKWLPKSELDVLDWAAADIPIVQKLMQN